MDPLKELGKLGKMGILKSKELNNRLKKIDTCHLLILSLEEKYIIHAHFCVKKKT